MLFDTNIIILYLAGLLEKKDLDNLELCLTNNTAYTSPVVIGELLAYSKQSEDKVSELEDFLYKNFKIISINKKIISKAAEISRYKKINYNKKLKMTDAIIVATSICKGIALVTKDKEDFNNILEMKLYN